jgi:hypothetical protein
MNGCFSPTIFLREIPEQSDWQETVHNVCYYPMALAGGQFVNVTSNYEFDQTDKINELAAFVLKVLAFTIFLPLAAIGGLGGKFSRSYALISKQQEWRAAPTTFTEALQLFPPKGIAAIMCEEESEAYAADFLQALNENEELLAELKENCNLAHSVAAIIDQVDTFISIYQSLEGRVRHSFIQGIVEFRSFAFWKSLPEKQLLEILNMNGDENCKIISSFTLKDIIELAEGKSSQFREGLSKLILSKLEGGVGLHEYQGYVRGIFDCAVLEKFCSLVSVDDAAKLLSLSSGAPLQRELAIYRGLLSGPKGNLLDISKCHPENREAILRLLHQARA